LVVRPDVESSYTVLVSRNRVTGYGIGQTRIVKPPDARDVEIDRTVEAVQAGGIDLVLHLTAGTGNKLLLRRERDGEVL
jgi:hypothetical protein